MTRYGYHGKILHVDLSAHRAWIEEPDEHFWRIYGGGGLLAAYYLLRECPRGADAFDPKRVVVKIPATVPGFAVTARLASQGVRVTLTAVCAVAQAILAQSVGARYVAVYLGRMRDDGLDALTLVGQMQGTLKAQRAAVEILAASVRSPTEVEAVPELQVAAVTLPFAVLQQLPESTGTMAAVAAFTDACRSLW
jgi:transaldolase